MGIQVLGRSSCTGWFDDVGLEQIIINGGGKSDYCDDWNEQE